jgi:hypothetical protein
MKKTNLKKSIVAASVAAGIAGGLVAGLALGVPGFAGAQANNSPLNVQGSSAALAKSAVVTLSDTIQVPSVGASSTGAKEKGPKLEAVAKVLGVTAEELKTELATKSLADVAKAKGVDITKVTDALVAEFKAHLDEEVASGEHTQAEADAKLAEFKTRVTDMVNKVRPARGPEGRGHGGPGKGGPKLEAAAKVLGLSAEELKTELATKSLADIRLPEEMPYALAELNVVTDQAVLPAPTAPIMPPIKVNINVRAEQGIFVRGRGVYAELSGALHLQGSLAKLNPEGRFKLRQGQYSLAGKTLVFSDGSIDFSKGDLTNPSLYFVASTRSDTITAQLTINGSATQPSINLTSSPVLPQDEILARVLFNQSTSNLSVMEMVQMGSALASLTGVRGNLNDPLEVMRKGLRLDRLSMGGSNNTVEAGRYLMPGVYVGAKQGITGTGTQATVQIDVTKELKHEASTGTATPTGKTTSTHSNSLGILYQFDY